MNSSTNICALGKTVFPRPFQPTSTDPPSVMGMPGMPFLLIPSFSRQFDADLSGTGNSRGCQGGVRMSFCSLVQRLKMAKPAPLA